MFTHTVRRKLGMDESSQSTERHHESPEPHEDGNGRRDFLKGALLAGGAVASAGVGAVAAQAQPGRVPGTLNHYYVPATDKTVHWGYFSKLLKPLVEVSSGDFVTDRKSTRLNSSHRCISYAVFCLKKKKKENTYHSSKH